MVAESFFLKFEPMEKTRNILKLLTCVAVQSIVNIKKGRGADQSLTLTFTSQDKKVILINLHLIPVLYILSNLCFSYFF